MKSERIVIVLLSLLVVGIAFWAFRKKGEEMPQPGHAETKSSNPTDLWHTNIVERWRTNTETITNTVLQPITNEVIKEVPARLAGDARQAAILGYKFNHAPILEDTSEALYRVGPVAVEVYLDAGSAAILGENMDELRKKVESALAARKVPLQEQGTQRLRVNVTPRWRMSDPRVAMVSCNLELLETVALDRQGDLIKHSTVVWSTSTSQFVQTMNMEQAIDKCIESPINRFCDDFLRAKEHEKEIRSRIPSVPAGFPSAAE